MSSKQDSVRVEKLTDGVAMAAVPQGNVLFGCPPEILKRLVSRKWAMPDTVVVPETHVAGHSSLISLEFPLYHFLFVQRGLEQRRQFQVISTHRERSLLMEMLRITVLGPDAKEMKRVGLPSDLADEIAQETTYLALKSPETQKPYRIDEMVRFRGLDGGERSTLYPATAEHPEVQLERLQGDAFRLWSGEQAHDITLRHDEVPTPPYVIQGSPFDTRPGQFRLAVLGHSNGFDPNDAANGYLINIDGRLIMWDAPAYFRDHLQAFEVEPDQIEALIISHVHEDHIDMVESFRKPPFAVYATPEVFYSMLVKVRAVLGCSLLEARRRYDYRPIDVTRPMQIAGANFRFFHAVHAIPAVGCRIEKAVVDAKGQTKKGVLHISGDHLSRRILESMQLAGGISDRRFAFIQSLLQGDETLVLMDAGGGLIHGEHQDYADSSLKIAFMHTPTIKDALPEGQFLVKSGQQLNVLP